MRLHDLLTKQEESYTLDMKEWVVREASNPDALQEAGTFRYVVRDTEWAVMLRGDGQLCSRPLAAEVRAPRPSFSEQFKVVSSPPKKTHKVVWVMVMWGLAKSPLYFCVYVCLGGRNRCQCVTPWKRTPFQVVESRRSVQGGERISFPRPHA